MDGTLIQIDMARLGVYGLRRRIRAWSRRLQPHLSAGSKRAGSEVLADMNTLDLREADRLEITVLVDNYTDMLLPGTEFARRLLSGPPNMPLAEHGLSCLLKVWAGSEEHAVLFDAGASPVCLFHNAKLLETDFRKIESVVLSHGHFDHYGGLIDLLRSAREGIPLVFHPDALLERRINIRAIGWHASMGVLSEKDLEDTGATVEKIAGASTLAADLVMVTGEVERVTDFEKGLMRTEVRMGSEWVSDPLRDDQGVAVKVKGRGLVVLGGCSHAGIINTIKHVQKVTGVERVHGVLGGFHLSGPAFEPAIEATIRGMKRIAPDVIVPMHCTGWQAIKRLAEAMPEQFILNSVGTIYMFH